MIFRKSVNTKHNYYCYSCKLLVQTFNFTIWIFRLILKIRKHIKSCDGKRVKCSVIFKYASKYLRTACVKYLCVFFFIYLGSWKYFPQMPKINARFSVVFWNSWWFFFCGDFAEWCWKMSIKTSFDEISIRLPPAVNTKKFNSFE